MKIETFINNEAKKYKGKAITNKNKRVNLDKLETMFRQHYHKCVEYIDKQDLTYQEQCKYKELADRKLQNVDNELFGCLNGYGQCVGYNFYQ